MRRIFVLVCATLIAGPAQGADVARGAALAEERCAQCHDISPDGVAKEHPPSFASIAGYRPAPQIEARIWEPDVHSAMPSMTYVLSREEMDDLMAFILSLE